MHIALPPSHCNPVLSSILTHNNPVGLHLETWLANCGDSYIPSITQGNESSGISNFMSRMRRSSDMLEIHTTFFKIQRHILQKLGQFLLQKFEVHLTCKTTFQNERTNQLIVQNCTPHIDTKTELKFVFHSGVVILICPHMRVVCIILMLSQLNCASSVNRM